MKEYWLEVRGHEKYEVSNCGNVRNKKSGRILKPELNRDGGYLRVNLEGDRDYVHRIMTRSFFEVGEDDFVVGHRDGNKANNTLFNLDIKSQ